MIIEKYLSHDRSPILGSLGHLALFAGSLTLVMLASPRQMAPVAVLSLFAFLLVYPASLRRLLRPRWLLLIAGLFALNLLWAGGSDEPGTPPGWVSGLQMALRTLIILAAVDGFTSSVEIAEVGGFFERLGLRGLGFSLGVAINLLPSLRQSSANAWHSLWMRGGLRRRRWRGLQLYLMTVIANALRRAEEIALAAETRAYSPQRSRPLPVKSGALDGLAWIGVLASALLIFLLF